MSESSKEKKTRQKPNELDEIVMDYGTDTKDDDQILDRRQSPRMAINGQVICLPLGATREIRGELLDYSGGGLYFGSTRKVKMADIVQVTYTPDGVTTPKDSIAQVIRVIKISKGYEIAVKFISEI